MNSFVKALKASVGNQLANEFCILDRRVIKKGVYPTKSVQTDDICSFPDDGSARNIKLSKFAKTAKQQAKKFENSRRKKIILVGGLMGDNFLRFHGHLTESESPDIPLVSNTNEISELFQSAITARMIYAKSIIQEGLTCFDAENIRWVVSPLPSESCAKIRFGAHYVSSRSQIIYNQYFNSLLQNILGEYLQTGIILCQPNSSITDTGFSLDKYSFSRGTDDVHLNDNYFKQFIDKI